MELTIDMIKILVAGGLFSSIIIVNDKTWKKTLFWVLFAYLTMLGANLI